VHILLSICVAHLYEVCARHRNHLIPVIRTGVFAPSLLADSPSFCPWRCASEENNGGIRHFQVTFLHRTVANLLNTFLHNQEPTQWTTGEGSGKAQHMTAPRGTPRHSPGEKKQLSGRVVRWIEKWPLAMPAILVPGTMLPSRFVSSKKSDHRCDKMILEWRL
jgi:hypothetical protein